MRNQIELIRLEVKYCENCGGLWCRQTGDTRIYCSICRPQVPSSDVRNRDRRHEPMMRGRTRRQRLQ
jgi:hypothetical protein